MKIEELKTYFEEVELEEEHKEYDGYFYTISDIICILILGSLCGLKNISQIHQWATNKRNTEFLKEKFKLKRIPCYYWLTCLLKMVKPESLNKCMVKWAEEIISEKRDNLTVSFDGKTIRSTGKMTDYDSPLHIVSAQIAELGITFASKSVDGKSNEIPAVQELIRELDLHSCIVVADALNCQRETAEAIIERKGDYLLDVKGNQGTLEEEIRDYVQDDKLRSEMDTATTKEKSRDRFEIRTAYTTTDLDGLFGPEKWKNMCCIGAIKTQFERKGVKTEEWHYYISSRTLTAKELLHHARMEWSVESMHWLLDVHFEEDYCRIINRNAQQNMNMLRKFSINQIKLFKTRTKSKLPLSKIMFDCLLDIESICSIFEN